ncbi:hypothetical protein [Dyella sp. ASV21]|uniref:hypothetical protein n=1 Tax=Dyella sp. ASV21 TaxID=2795114 RepID=UPI0018EC0552|nr:hypothetical protein [Dyella sp. ASV21]
MQAVKSGDVYKIARITGAQDNFLGVRFAARDGEIELVALGPKDARKIGAEPGEVLRQVTIGLADVNLELGTSYCLSKIFYLPSESTANSVYELLIAALVKKIEAGDITEGPYPERPATQHFE